MRTILLSLMISGWALSQPVFGQRHELGLMLGGFKPSNRTFDLRPPVPAELSSGLAVAHDHLRGDPRHARFGDALPHSRPPAEVLAQLCVAPFVAAGGGYALFEHSSERMDGQPNSAPRRISQGAVNFGGGVDITVWRFVSLRGEVRDFLSGSPNFNLPVTGKQHSILVAGGVAIRF